MKPAVSPGDFTKLFITSGKIRALALIIFLLLMTAVLCEAQENEKTGSGSKRPVQRNILGDEMVSPDDFDTGVYKAVIIRDPENKRQCTGHVNIPPITYKDLRTSSHTRAYSNLNDIVTDFKGYSPIEVIIDEPIQLGSQKLLKYPLVIIESLGFELTESEKRNFGRYIRKGGFVVIEFFIPGNKNLRNYLGREAKFKPVPDNHLIYNSYFDLTNEPLKFSGIWINEKLTGVFFSLRERLQGKSRRSELRRNMGINIIVYSLIREGSVAKKVLK